MELDRIRILAQQVLNVGKSKIWLDPSQREDISKAISKDDVRGLVSQGSIKKRQDNLQSKGRARVLKIKKRKGRKKGPGKKGGTKKARIKKKETWIKNVRAQRKTLRKLKKEEPELFNNTNYQKVYRKIKGGFYKGKKYVEAAVRGSN